MFEEISRASPTNPPGLSNSNVLNSGNAANLPASPFSIGPDAITVELLRQVKVMAFAKGIADSQTPTANETIKDNWVFRFMPVRWGAL
jgi:hypothetical protein